MNRAAQLRSAQRSYDNASPPEPVDYDYTDADSEIAASLVKSDEVADMVMEVRNSADFLNWIAYNVALPKKYLHEFRELDRRAKRLSDPASELCERAA